MCGPIQNLHWHAHVPSQCVRIKQGKKSLVFNPRWRRCVKGPWAAFLPMPNLTQLLPISLGFVIEIETVSYRTRIFLLGVELNRNGIDLELVLRRITDVSNNPSKNYR